MHGKGGVFFRPIPMGTQETKSDGCHAENMILVTGDEELRPKKNKKIESSTICLPCQVIDSKSTWYYILIRIHLHYWY